MIVFPSVRRFKEHRGVLSSFVLKANKINITKLPAGSIRGFDAIFWRLLKQSPKLMIGLTVYVRFSTTLSSLCSFKDKSSFTT